MQRFCRPLLVAIVVLALVGGFAQPGSAESRGQSVVGSIAIGGVGNSITVAARTDASGDVRGFVILVSGYSVQLIQVTCLQVTGSVALVGGTTIKSTPSAGTPNLHYGFVLQDSGPGVADRSTIFGFSDVPVDDPCATIFPPAVEQALKREHHHPRMKMRCTRRHAWAALAVSGSRGTVIQ